MAVVMSVHAPKPPPRESERGRDRVAKRKGAQGGGVAGTGCVLTGYRSRRVREEGLLLLPPPLVRTGITQLFNLKPPDSN